LSLSSVTETRELKSGIPVWAGYSNPTLAAETLSRSLKTDVVVVGSGISGALVAEATSRVGLATIILDRRAPGHGSTFASTALLQFEIDTPLIRLAEQIGMERARRVWQRSFRAVADLQQLVQDLQIPCQLRSRRALYLSGSKLDSAAMAQECQQRRLIGLPSCLLSESLLHDITGIRRDAALYSDGVADVNPMQLTIGLLTRAQSRGCRLFSPVQLAEVEVARNRVFMSTDTGIELEAKALVFATGYELAKGVPSLGHLRSSTWAFATPPQPNHIWKGEELIWEAEDPYLYLRTTIDGRALVGGEDEEVEDAITREKLLSKKIMKLQKKVSELFPKLDITAEFVWAGVFGHNETGLPTFGAVPGMPNCYAVLGYGGNGFTFSMVAAQVILGELCGRSDPDAEVFSFHI
jgi:glycine/D-amino acid oxidase-like deaminating enzyme